MKWRGLRVGCGLIAGALLSIHAGGTSSVSSMVDQINEASRRPITVPPPSPGIRNDMVWVPDRYVSVPGEPAGAWVPGHWERQLSGGEYYAPPLPIVKPNQGTVETLPAGVKPPPETRSGP